MSRHARRRVHRREARIREAVRRIESNPGHRVTDVTDKRSGYPLFYVSVDAQRVVDDPPFLVFKRSEARSR